MTLGEVLGSTAGYLARKGIDTPRLDAELILAHAFGLSRLELYTSFDRPLTEAERDRARPLVERRGRREPLAYVLGEWGFRRLTLKTDARALVPRPETEIVVERALAAIEQLPAPRVVDVGHRHRRDRARDRRRASRRASSPPPMFRPAPSSSPARTPRGSAWRFASSRRACSTVSTGRSTWSSRTHRTWAPKRSMPSSRRCATGSRGSRSSATGRPSCSPKPRARDSPPAERSCSRATRAVRRRSPPSSRSGLPGGDGSRDLAGRERVVEARWT